jgi:transportin-1
MMLTNPAYVEILMPPLTPKWATLKDDEEDLIPLLEASRRVCSRYFRPPLTLVLNPVPRVCLDRYGPSIPVVRRTCIRAMHQRSLIRSQTYQQNPECPRRRPRPAL